MSVAGQTAAASTVFAVAGIGAGSTVEIVGPSTPRPLKGRVSGLLWYFCSLFDLKTYRRRDGETTSAAFPLAESGRSLFGGGPRTPAASAGEKNE